MKTFKLEWSLIFFWGLTTFLSLEPGGSEGTFLSGWILPNPSEVVIIGLFFLKIIGLQLAVAHGYLSPPHNPYFGRRRKRGTRVEKSGNSTIKRISLKEFKSIERVLLSLRRIDSKDCFLRSVCQMNQDNLLANTGKSEDKGQSKSNIAKLLQVFRLRKLLGIKSKSGEVWDIYEDATGSEVTNCSKKYPACPLTLKELELDMRLGTSLKSF